MLLRRDPWLISQTLMQLLYLVPPALMLWRSFSDSSTAIVLITPVIVMAAGQLSGGLAWLTISGEDAADLVATAPSAAQVHTIQYLFFHECVGELGRMVSVNNETNPVFTTASIFRRLAL